MINLSSPGTLPKLFALCIIAPLLMASTHADGPRVNGERLNATMEKMKSFGRSETGGSERVAYSQANRDALNYLARLMREAGLQTHIDYAGNLLGRLHGKQPLPPLMLGSHIDTVPNGGHYDGIVGVMAAIEVAQALHAMGIVPDHPVEVVVWANEEGGKTGSRSLNGSVAKAEMALPSLGDKTLGDGIDYLGGDAERIFENRRDAGSIAAYLELHVEQGAILDRHNTSIGVVDGIVGIRRWNVQVDGFANHAGTTPMDQRQDALLASAAFVIAVREEAVARPGRQVATVGRIHAQPGAPNVIPGQATLSLEIRDLDMDNISELFSRLRNRAKSIGTDTGTYFRFEQFYESPAALTDTRISTLIAASADSLQLDYEHLPSGAGHDAQSIAPLAPIGMIFVPSRDGVSHAPTEFTAPEDIVNGANVLLRTLLKLDKQSWLSSH